MLFVGALTDGKRPDRFIEVVARLRAQGTPVRAELIGDGPLRDAVAGPAEAAEVELLGSRSDVAEQMRRADVMVFCSRPAGEGMPGVLIEAGLSGLPVVATSVPGVTADRAGRRDGLGRPGRRSVRHGGRHHQAGRRSGASIGGWATAARARCAEHFSLAAVAARWLAFIQPLLDTGRPGRPPR